MDGEHRPSDRGSTTGSHNRGAAGDVLFRALQSGCETSVFTDLDGIVRHVICPDPVHGVAVAGDLPGQNVTAIFAADEHWFIGGVLEMLRHAAHIAADNVPVHVTSEPMRKVYVSVSHSHGSAQALWRFSLDARSTTGHDDDRERALLHRIETLEARAEAHRKAVERSQRVVRAAIEANRGLSRGLRASRDLRSQDAAILRDVNHAKDDLLRRERESREDAYKARRRAEDGQRRLAVLAEASRELTETLDFNEILKRLAGLVVPEIADFCAISTLDEEQRVLRLTEVAGRNGEEVAPINGPTECRVDDIPMDHPVRHAIGSGRSYAVYDVPEGQSGAFSDPFNFLPLPHDDRIHSYFVTPLRVREQTFGILMIGSYAPSQQFGPEDVLFVDDLALRAAQALDNARLFEHAEEASTVRERYVSMASHELRSPLTIVSGFGALLLRDLENPHADREKLLMLGKEMNRGLERLEMLTHNLLITASLQHGSAYERRSHVDLVPLIQQLIERLRNSESKWDAYRISLDAPSSLVGHWDGESIERAISNVVSNALKYSPRETPISVIVGQVDNVAEIWVQDQGIGMTSEEQEALFSPFVRSPAARQVADGTGLGLYITQQILEQHHGQVDVESEPGSGSTFIIRLPVDLDVHPYPRTR